MQEILIRLYRTDPRNAEICERFVDLDEGLQEWRYRHVKMVERTIGTKPEQAGRRARAISPEPSRGLFSGPVGDPGFTVSAPRTPGAKRLRHRFL